MTDDDQGTTSKINVRLRVGGMPAHTATGWGWWYEIHDTSRPEGSSVVMSGIRHTWHAAMLDGATARRYVEGNRACGFE